MEGMKHKKIIRKYYSKRARDYDRQKTRTWKSKQGFGDQVFNRLLDSLNELEDKTGLEVCTGSGRTSLPLLKTTKLHLVGLDFSKEMLENAKAKTSESREKTELVLGDAESLPFTNEVFDALVCISAMHYFDKPLENLSGFSGTLRKRGILVYGDLTLHESDSRRFLDRLERTVSPAHGRYFKPSEIMKMLRKAGFSVTELHTFPYRKPLESLIEDKGRYFDVRPEALQGAIKNASEREKDLYLISNNELTLFYTLIKASKE